MSEAATAVLRLEPVRDALTELGRRDAVARLHARDAELWSHDPATREAISARLGWLDAAHGDWSAQLASLADGIRADGLAHVVLAGMGGSSLAPEVFAQVFAQVLEGRVKGATLTVLDSTHPDAVRARLDGADLERTLVVVASKSGSTIETACFAQRAAALVPQPRHLLAITDPGSALDEQAGADGWRGVLRNPADIGGRYSALSLFGMAPAALLGVDVDAVWGHAAALLAACGPDVPDDANPAAQLAAFMAGLAAAGRDKLTLLLSPELAALGDWIEQLVAESTGKQGRGVVPIVGEPVGDPSVYGSDRAFVVVRFAGHQPDGATELAAAGHPVFTIDVAEREQLGAEFLRWELATALAGALLGVNPFDEPNVTESKRNTAAVLAEVADGRPLAVPEHGDVPALLATLRPGDYLSVQAYLPPQTWAAGPLTALRSAVRDRTDNATTLGWGPRFLHSTGQLHKGGPDRVVVLQIVDARLWDDQPLEIPGRPYDFGTLVRAQALGDLRALRDRGLRVAQVAVSDAADLERLREAAAHG